MGNRYYKNPIECKKKAVNLIKQFVEQKLNKELLNLKNYTFWNIDGNPIFGNGTKYSDADCTKIVYAIDYILYYDALKDENGDFFIPGYPYKSVSNFKGETIFTFKTLFGTQKNMEDKTKDFHDCYQKLGATSRASALYIFYNFFKASFVFIAKHLLSRNRQILCLCKLRKISLFQYVYDKFSEHIHICS